MKHHSQLKEIIQATYQQLDEKLDKRRIDFMSWLIIALCMSKTVNFLSLAEKIDRKGKLSSHYKRIQRFMKEVPFNHYSAHDRKNREKNSYHGQNKLELW